MINKEKFLRIVKQSKTPLYIFDKKEAQKNIRSFKNAFKKYGVDLSIFFATKSNYYPGLLRTVVSEGENIDVSSRRELKLALKAGSKRIIYTGPAKTRDDFELILKHHSKVTVNLESLRELELMAKMAREKKVTMRCGVRIYTKMQSGWTKFGIPLSDLKGFYDQAQKYKYINFCGVHFHISFNKTPDKYLKTLDELSKYFKKHFRVEERLDFEYIDIGGGFYPETSEGIYPWNPNQETHIPDFDKHIKHMLADKFKPRYLPIKVDPIDVFAEKISAVYKNTILPLLPNVHLYAEPGRFISHSTMHFLLTIMDVKDKNLAITDGGTNMVGWEKHQFFYYVPLINLSQFDLKREIPFVLYGSLCTPDDIWGYYMFTKGLPKSGDIILMPYQGAYTYTLAQEFIKEIPEVWEME
ncbi:MAG: alanine racemase [Patescibacteria group bacterium]|nr:alanine racemase [Patescibacteria group bacterium]